MGRIKERLKARRKERLLRSQSKGQSIANPFEIHPQQEQYIVKPFQEWLYSDSKRGMFLGFRKCGKTDLITIQEISEWVAEDTNRTVIIMTRKQDRARAIVRKIGDNLRSIGIKGEYGQDQIRLTREKQPTVLGLTVNSTTKGWHADLLIMDDPVEPRDEYSMALKQRVELVFNESKNIATRTFVIGQYVSRDDIYTLLENLPNIEIMTFWVGIAEQSLIDILDLDLEDLKTNMSYYGKNYEGLFYPDENNPFSDVLTGDYGNSFDYALLDPSNGKNDYTAIVYLKDYGHHVAIFGKMYKEDWITAITKELDNINQMQRFYWEENTIGAGGHHFFKQHIHCRTIRFTTTTNKVEKILSILHLVKLGKIRIHDKSDKIFIDNIKNWNPKAGNNQLDDGIDAVAMIVQKLGLFK